MRTLSILVIALLVPATALGQSAPAPESPSPPDTPSASEPPTASDQAEQSPSEPTHDQAAEAAARESNQTQRLDAANAAAVSGQTVSAPDAFVLGGYAEVFWQWNFNEPSNGITDFRGFDNRHNSFTLANVALDATWDYEGVVGRVTLQVGHTPNTYYAAEPRLQGGTASNPTDANLWKYLQQAYVGYRIPFGNGVLVQAGIFLSPIGPEGMAIRDNWNWSRSNLFFGCPFYHTGVRVSYPVNDEWTVSLSGYNGWNSVVDNNDEKSVSVQATYTNGGTFSASLLYFGGVERPTGASEGRAWRNLFDAYATWSPTDWFSLLAHADAGFEPNNFGTSGWGAGALYGRFKLIPELFAVVRGDFFYEAVAQNPSGRAAAIFWPSEWVSSGTATLDFRPHERVSFRLEYRHDHAAGLTYFGGTVLTDPAANNAYVANRASQDTVTVGATTWF